MTQNGNDNTTALPSILFCLDYYYPHLGGAEVLFQNLAEGLVRKGHKVRVVTQLVKNAPKEECVNGVSVIRVQTWGQRHLFPLAALPALLKHAGEASIIHATTFAAAWPAWICAKIKHIPTVLTVHEVWVGIWHKVSDAGVFSNFLNGFFERTIYWPNFTKYIAVSNATASALANIGTPKDKIAVIHNGIDYTLWNKAGHDGVSIRRQLGLSPQNFLFFFSGRPGRSKGLPVLLRAFAQIAIHNDNARLLVLASTSPACRKGLREAREIVTSLGLTEKALFHTPVPREELPDWVAAADCVCVPSLSEGFGFTAAEACAIDKPVIATDNASLPEVVGGRFILVPPNDSDAFAHAMQNAIQGNYTTTPVPQFTLQDNIRKHQVLYDTILAH